MSMLFRFEKWFFDFLTPKKDYLLFYYTYTRILFFRVVYLELHFAPYTGNPVPTGSFQRNYKMKVVKRVNHSIWTNRGTILKNDNGFSFDLRWPDLTLNLKVFSGQDPPKFWPDLIIKRSRNQQILWAPLLLHGRFHGEILLDQKYGIEGFSGYADYLSSTILPTRIPVRELFWARLHHRETDITFALAQNLAAKQNWQILIVQAGEHIYQLDRVEVKIVERKYSERMEMNYPEIYQIMGRSPQLSVDLTITHELPAVESRFLDTPEGMSKMQARFLKRVSHDPRGIKFFSRVAGNIELPDIQIELIDDLLISEYVAFSD